MKLVIVMFVAILAVASAQTQRHAKTEQFGACDSNTNCDSCTANLGCGWCSRVTVGAAVVDTCQPGTASGPNGFLAIHCVGGYSHGPNSCAASNPTTPAGTGVATGGTGTGGDTDCSSATTCSSCAMRSACGWCSQVLFMGALVDTCMAGTVSGPTGVTGGSSVCQNGWRYVRAACPAMPPVTPVTASASPSPVGPTNECSAYTTCRTCTARPSCGFCGDRCVRSTATGPIGAPVSSCAGSFNWISSTCPRPPTATPTPGPTPTPTPTPVGTPTPAPVSCDAITTCDACADQSGCGWCESVPVGPNFFNLCVPGTESGPSGFLASSCLGGYSTDSDTCPSSTPTTPSGTGPVATTCASLSTCDACTASPQCGFCSQVPFGSAIVDVCVDGNAAGPTGPDAFPANLCAGGYAFVSSTCNAVSPTTPIGTGTAVAVSCNTHSSCGSCNAAGCGWCQGVLFNGAFINTCLPGDAAGPFSLASGVCGAGWIKDQPTC